MFSKLGSVYSKASLLLTRRSTMSACSDSALFRVSKAILAEASAVFDTMFSLPQPISDTSYDEGIPIVSVTETSRTLDRLSHVCHSVSKPALEMLDDVDDLLEVAKNYKVEMARELGRKALLLSGLLQQQAFGVRALALKHGLEEET